MEKYFNGLVSEPARLFHKQYQSAQETNRILTAITPVALEHSSEDIAAEVNDERAVTPKNLRGIVQIEANKITKDLERKVVSLQSMLDKQGWKPGAVKKTNKKSNGKKYFCRNGKTATTVPAPQERNGARGPRDATSSTAKGSVKGRSKSKSNGNKQVLTTKKRS